MIRLALVCAVLAATPAIAAEEEPDPAAVAVLNKLMDALLIEDLEKSIKESVKVLHKSLLNKAGDDVSADLRRFSYKKAHDNAKLYGSPVKVARVRATGATSIGFKETAEKGKVFDYMLEKKEGGLPAAVKVFFPEAGGDPKIAYIGAL